jgi:hypothetical protein
MTAYVRISKDKRLLEIIDEDAQETTKNKKRKEIHIPK